MRTQKLIYDYLEDAITGIMGWCNHLSKTSLIQVMNFPAVLIEMADRPITLENANQSDTVTKRTERLEVSLLIELENAVELDNDNYTDAVEDAEEKIAEITEKIIAMSRLNGISNVRFEDIEISYAQINDTNALIATMPVTLIMRQ
jgi:hypothetical protein